MDAPQSPTDSNPASPGWSRSIERLRTATAGRFTILRELGRGGFATVFLAQQHKPNRRVAIKLLSPALLDSDWALEHFRGESQKIAEWRHQAVVTIYEVHEEDSLLYFVMSYVEGASLHELIQLLGPLPIAIVLSVLAQVGSALQYAHRQGVTHRDIKPHNILVDVDGGAVVTDFGIAKQADGPSHTVTGMIVGTAPYMAPEQCESGRTSSASDQYALGVVAYEMLVGTPPFTGAPMAVLMAHLQQPVPSIRERRPDCPPELEAAVLRMLAKKPSDRFDSVAAAVDAAGAMELSELHPERRWFAASARRLAARQQAPVLDVVSMPPAIEVGERIPIGAEARTSAGEPLADVPVEWSGDGEGLVSLDAVSGRGTLTGIQPGLATVVVRGGGVEHQIRLEVQPARPAVLALHGPVEPVRAGDTTRLAATVTSHHGVPLDAAVRWQSEQPRLATITPDGELHAHQAGRVRIVASAGAASGELWVEIAPPLVDAVRVTGDGSPLLVGEHRPLSALVLDDRGHPLADRAVRWSSSDREIALVSSAGRVTGCAAGPVTITATCEERTATLQLAVREPPVTSVELVGPSSGLQVGDRIRLQAIVHAADGRALSREVTWHAENPAIAAVDSDGTVTALAPGVAVVAAMCEGARSTVRLAVIPDAPAFLPVVPGPARSTSTGATADADSAPEAVGEDVATGVTSWLPAADRPSSTDAAAAPTATDAPAVDAPAMDGPVVDASAADAPTANATVLDAPKANATVAGSATADAMMKQAPAADSPAPEAPAADSTEPDATGADATAGPAKPVTPRSASAGPTADVTTPVPAAPEPGPLVDARARPAADAGPTPRPARPPLAGRPRSRRAYVAGALGLAALAALAVAILDGGAGSGSEGGGEPPSSASSGPAGLAGSDAAAGGAGTGTVAGPSSAPAPYAPRTALPPVPPVAASADSAPAAIAAATDSPAGALVRAGEVAVTPLVVRAPASSVVVGDSLVLRATRDGRPAGSVAWRSTNPTRATVSTAGVVRARGDGRVAIVASAGGSADTVALTVQPRPAAEVAAGRTDQPVAAPLQPVSPPIVRAPTSSTTAGRTAAPPPPPTAAPPAAPTAAAAAESQLRRLVDGYAAALRGRSLEDAVRLYPAMSQNDRDGWRSFFGFARDLQVGMRVEELTVSGATASARVSGEYRYTNPATRRPCSQPLTLQMRFARADAGWQITGIDQQQGRGSGC